MLQKNPLAPKFPDQGNPRFRDIHRACDSTSRELHQQGVVTKIRHAVVISCQDENKLWSTSVFGTETPLSLQRAAFFFLWEKDFALEEVMNKDA